MHDVTENEIMSIGLKQAHIRLSPPLATSFGPLRQSYYVGCNGLGLPRWRCSCVVGKSATASEMLGWFVNVVCSVLSGLVLIKGNSRRSRAVGV